MDELKITLESEMKAKSFNPEEEHCCPYGNVKCNMVHACEKGRCMFYPKEV